MFFKDPWFKKLNGQVRKAQDENVKSIEQNCLYYYTTFFFYDFTECDLTVACDAENEVYSHVDCDGDGILDHACRTTNHQNHWLILSSEGCRNCWGTSNRCTSECPAAWPSKGNK